MSDLENKKEDDFIEFIERTTSSINMDEEAQKENLSTILNNNTEFNEVKSKEIVEDISKTIDLIQDNFEDLQKAKDAGKSRSAWFKEQIDQTIEIYKIESPNELIAEIKDGLSESNTKIGTEVFGNEINISEPLLNPTYDDLNKTAIINDLHEEVKNNTLLGAIVFENGKIKIDDTHKEIQAVKEYFNAKLDSPTDKAFKKAVSTATVIAQAKDLVPKKIKDKSPDELAFIVDKGVTSAKVAYKVAKGELSPLDAVEYTIDRNMSALNSVITKTCTRVGGKIGGKVGASIGSVFGPVGTAAGAKIGTVVGKAAGYAVGKKIGEGVNKVAGAAKSVVSKGLAVVKEKAKSVWNWLTS